MSDKVQNIEHFNETKSRMVQKCVQARRSGNMSQDFIAHWLGVDRRKIIAIESGNGDFETLLRYADKMSIDIKITLHEL